jgi:hypothetical protein
MPTKILFPLDPDDWHGRVSESLWAAPLHESAVSNAFEIQNSPFFARGISFLDVVRAVRHPEYGDLEFAGVVDRGGHSTYMILVTPDNPAFASYWKRLEDVGCTYESANLKTAVGDRVLYSVDVPETTDVRVVYAVLAEGEQKDIWLFQEGHVGHTLGPTG